VKVASSRATFTVRATRYHSQSSPTSSAALSRPYSSASSTSTVSAWRGVSSHEGLYKIGVVAQVIDRVVELANDVVNKTSIRTCVVRRHQAAILIGIVLGPPRRTFAARLS
jgi:hypothetical protein